MQSYTIFKTPIFKNYITNLHNNSFEYLIVANKVQKEKIKKDIGKAEIFYKNTLKNNPHFLTNFVITYKYTFFSKKLKKNEEEFNATTIKRYSFNSQFGFNSKNYIRHIDVVNDMKIRDNYFTSYMKNIMEIITYGVDFDKIKDSFFLTRYFSGLIEKQLRQSPNFIAMFHIFSLPYNFGDDFYMSILNHIHNYTTSNGYMLSSHCLLNEKISMKIKEKVLIKDMECLKSLIKFIFSFSFKMLKTRYPFWLGMIIEALYNHLKPEVKIAISLKYNTSDDWVSDLPYDQWEDLFENLFSTEAKEYLPIGKILTYVNLNNEKIFPMSYEGFKNRTKTNLYTIKSNQHLLTNKLISEVAQALISYMHSFHDLKFGMTNKWFIMHRSEINLLLNDYSMPDNVGQYKEYIRKLRNIGEFVFKKATMYEFKEKEIEKLLKDHKKRMKQLKEDKKAKLKADKKAQLKADEEAMIKDIVEDIVSDIEEKDEVISINFSIHDRSKMINNCKVLVQMKEQIIPVYCSKLNDVYVGYSGNCRFEIKNKQIILVTNDCIFNKIVLEGLKAYKSIFEENNEIILG